MRNVTTKSRDKITQLWRNDSVWGNNIRVVFQLNVLFLRLLNKNKIKSFYRSLNIKFNETVETFVT